MFIGNDSRTVLLMGINKVADFVSATMGPGGKAINIRRGNNNHITKDGVTVAKYFQVEDPAEQVGVDFIVEAAQKTVTAAGDGTTTTTVMARNMMLDAHHRLAWKRLNTQRITKELVNFSEKAIKFIEAQSIKVAIGDDTEELLIQVGSISANGDRKMAEMALEAIKAVGPEPNSINYTAAEFDEEDTLILKTGMHLPNRTPPEMLGGFSRRTITNLSDGGKVAVLIVPSTTTELTLPKALDGIFKTIQQQGHGLVLVCKEPSVNLKTYLVNRSERFQTVYVTPNLHGTKYQQLCEDLIILTGAKKIYEPEELEDPLPPVYMGFCNSADVGRDGTTLVDPQKKGSEEHKQLIDIVERMIKEETNSQNRDQLKDRLARITNGVANIRVTHGADSNMYERLDRYDDCVRAMITAIKTGIVRGGGAAYLSAAYQLLSETVDPLDQEKKLAKELIETALITPFNVITTNALNYIPKINGRQLVNETDLTIDVWTGDFISAAGNGIYDPLGVQLAAIRSAVNATSIFLNTGGMYKGTNDFM